MEKFKIFQIEILFDFLLMVLGVAIIIISLAYGFGTFRRPGPGLYPFFIGVSIVVFSIATPYFRIQVSNECPFI